jgi:high-affinity nickel permease
MLDNDASTAKTLTLVAIILQAVFFVIGIFEVIGVAAFLTVATTTSVGNVTALRSTPIGVLGLISLIFAAALAVGVLWILLDYLLVYKKLSKERVREAETPSLILGIIQLIFGGFIPGILLIIAYVKIKDSLQRSASTPPPPQ